MIAPAPGDERVIASEYDNTRREFVSPGAPARAGLLHFKIATQAQHRRQQMQQLDLSKIKQPRDAAAFSDKVEDVMNTRSEPGTDIYRKATADDVRHVLGEIEDVTLAEILSYAPSFHDLSDAAIWVRGDGDLIAREHRELSANALAIAELLSRVEEEEAPQQG